MFFSWLFLLFLASYGFSGAQSHDASEYLSENAAAENYGSARSLAGMDADYGYYRADEGAGPGLISEGLDKVVKLLSSLVNSTDQAKRNGYRSKAMQNKLNAQLREAHLYADMMEKRINKGGAFGKRSKAWLELYD